MLGLGLPMAASTLLMSFSSAISNRLTVSYGNVAVAARSVAGKSAMLIPMIVMGLCMGVQPAISYVYGCRDRERLRKIVLGVGAVCVGVAALMSAAFFLFREQFVAAFSPDPEIISLGRYMMLGTLLAVPVEGVYHMCSTYLQATGKVSYATLTSLMQKGRTLLLLCFGRARHPDAPRPGGPTLVSATGGTYPQPKVVREADALAGVSSARPCRRLTRL